MGFFYFECCRGSATGTGWDVSTLEGGLAVCYLGAMLLVTWGWWAGRSEGDWLYALFLSLTR